MEVGRMVQYVAIRVFQVQRHGGVQDMFWREDAPWWVRRGRKLDLGRSGQKGGVEDIANLWLVHLSSSGLWPRQGILGDPVLSQMHISKRGYSSSGRHSWGVAAGLIWLANLKEEAKQCSHSPPFWLSWLLGFGRHTLSASQLECFRQAVGMMVPAPSRSRCVHRISLWLCH